MSPINKTCTIGSKNMGQDSKERNVISCPTWRQLTIQKSGTKNEPWTSGRTCEKVGVRCSAENSNHVAISSDGDTKTDCPSDSKEVTLKDQKLSIITSSHRKKKHHNRQIAEVKLHEWKNTFLLSSNKCDLNFSKHLNVKQPKIVLVDCMRSSTVEVGRPRISSTHCIEKLTITTPKNNGTLCKPTSKNYKKKIKSDHNKPTSKMPESNEHSTKYSDESSSKASNDGQPALSASRRTSLTESKPTTFHRPTWRQLTKQEPGLVGGLTNSNDFEPRIESKKASREVYRENDSGSTAKTNKRRQVQELDGQDCTIIPTWRQLTKLQSGSFKTQSIPKYFEGSDLNRKSSIKKQKIRRQNLEGTTGQKEITSQKNHSGSLHESSKKNKSTSFEEISSDCSKSQVKSLKGYHKLDKKSTADQDSASVMHGALSESPKPQRSPCPESSAPDPSQNLMHNDEHGTKSESKRARSEPFSETLSVVPGEKPLYECSMCDFRGSQLGMIWNHILDHKIHDNGEKPYACDECDYRAKTEPLLRSHKITHSGEKPYPCDLCDRRCRTITHLRIHKILRHKEKPLACHECDFKCADERLFYAHTRIHTAEDKPQT